MKQLLRNLKFRPTWLLLLCLTGVEARATLWMEDAFAYAAGNLNGQGGWSGGSGSQVISGSLSYAGLAAPTTLSNKVSLPVTASTASKSFSTSAITNGSVYLSFILRQTTLAASTTASTVAGLDDDGAYTTGSGRVAAALGVHVRQTNTTNYLLGIRKALGATAGGGTDLFYSGAAFSVGDVVFVVARYAFGPGVGDDTVTLWVNPPTNSFGGLEPTPSIAATNTGNTTDAAQLQYAYVRCNSSTTSGVNEVDDLRVGSSWADVTPPASGVPPPAATNAQPVITQVQLVGSQLILRGTNGVTNGVYQVLGADQISLPLATWPSLSTNQFDASGNFATTNPALSGAARRFYRVLVGGQLPPPVVNPPVILTQPTNLVLASGQTAVFAATADGTAPLSYQWFFNTNTAVAGATSNVLVLSNIQLTDAGTYALRVTNSAGTVSSVAALLTVNALPVITQQPQSLTVTESNAANFSVLATGSSPLRYQWYFNAATPLPGATNFTLSIAPARLTNVGDYRVVITNSFGSVTSAPATLAVNPASSAPDFSLVGFAALDGFASNNTLQVGGTTGGAAGALVVASNTASFKAFLESATPYRVLVTADIDLSSLANNSGGFPADYPTGEILVRSHKTLYSTNGATISRGSLRIGKPSLGPQQNIIIRNLKFRDLWVYDPSGNYDTYGWDYVHLEEGSHHVWVDHCDFQQVYDGMVDVVHASDYVTVSWNVFRFQKKCSLIGHSDSNAAEDTGHLNVTFHHNYYVDVAERMPRMRFGNAHVFNLYCENLGVYSPSNNLASAKGIQSTAAAATLVENSYFEHALTGTYPTIDVNGGPSGTIKVVGSVIANSPGANGFIQNGAATFVFNAPFVTNQPPYNYALDAVANVPNLVTNWAGVGKLTSY